MENRKIKLPTHIYILLYIIVFLLASNIVVNISNCFLERETQEVIYRATEKIH